MADLFISYKREDRDRVEPLARALEGEGFSVWWDPELPIFERYDTTRRANLVFDVDLKESRDIYIEVDPYSTFGRYRLRVD